jgi:hypothetical protein
MAGGSYRDELAAAHGRIADLEEKVSALEAELAGRGRGAPDGLEALEEEVAVRRKATAPTPRGYRRAAGGVIALIFALWGGGFLSQPRASGRLGTMVMVCAVLFVIAVAIWRTVQRGERITARWALRAAESRLAAARAAARRAGPRIDDSEAARAGPQVASHSQESDLEDAMVEPTPEPRGRAAR